MRLRKIFLSRVRARVFAVRPEGPAVPEASPKGAALLSGGEALAGEHFYRCKNTVAGRFKENRLRYSHFGHLDEPGVRFGQVDGVVIKEEKQ